MLKARFPDEELRTQPLMWAGSIHEVKDAKDFINKCLYVLKCSTFGELRPPSSELPLVR